MKKETLKKGYGYWDTTNYPIGGCFKRASKNIEIKITYEFSPKDRAQNRGCSHIGLTKDNHKIAFNIRHTVGYDNKWNS